MPLYFLALLLPEEIADRIVMIKKEVERKYGVRHALNSPPHITLQKPFRRPQTDEPLFLEKISAFASCQSPFNIELSGFDVFAPRVIFVDVTRSKELQDRYEKLQEFLHAELGFSSHTSGFGFNPHVTIATRDLKNYFHEVWDDFKNQNFEADFVSDALAMLKHNGKSWDVWHQFPWKG